MTLEQRQALTRSIPADLAPADVVVRHGNGMLGPLAECWYVSIRGTCVPDLSGDVAFFGPGDAAKLRAQILEVSEAKATYQAARVAGTPSATCPICLDMSAETGYACAPCIEAYQLTA